MARRATPPCINTAHADPGTVVADMPRPGRRSAAPPLVEIVVPARNEALRLPEGLAALCRHAATLPLRTAIVVVNSASTDLTGDIVRGWPAGPVPVRLVQCDRAGKGLAVQAGLPGTRAAARSLRTACFAFDVELIARCQRLGATLTEIPVCWRDVPGSTFSVPRHTVATFRDVASIWLRLRADYAAAGRAPAPVPALPADVSAGLQALPAAVTTA